MVNFDIISRNKVMQNSELHYTSHQSTHWKVEAPEQFLRNTTESISNVDKRIPET
jgi:hypothetical protein